MERRQSLSRNVAVQLYSQPTAHDLQQSGWRTTQRIPASCSDGSMDCPRTPVWFLFLCQASRLAWRLIDTEPHSNPFSPPSPVSRSQCQHLVAAGQCKKLRYSQTSWLTKAPNEKIIWRLQVYPHLWMYLQQRVSYKHLCTACKDHCYIFCFLTMSFFVWFGISVPLVLDKYMGMYFFYYYYLYFFYPKTFQI